MTKGNQLLTTDRLWPDNLAEKIFSGFSNEELEAAVYQFAEQFGFEDLLGKIVKGFAMGATASLAIAIALAIRENRITQKDLKRAIQDGYFTAAFGALVDFIINDDRLF